MLWEKRPAAVSGVGGAGGSWARPAGGGGLRQVLLRAQHLYQIITGTHIFHILLFLSVIILRNYGCRKETGKSMEL